VEEVGIDARLVKISVLIRHARPVRCGLLMTCATTMGSINWPNGHYGRSDKTAYARDR
jgi:hypothetical protein